MSSLEDTVPSVKAALKRSHGEFRHVSTRRTLYNAFTDNLESLLGSVKLELQACISRYHALCITDIRNTDRKFTTRVNQLAVLLEQYITVGRNLDTIAREIDLESTCDSVCTTCMPMIQITSCSSPDPWRYCSSSSSDDHGSNFHVRTVDEP